MADDFTGMDKVAWFLQAARDHPPELLRTLSYLAVAGNEGIAAPTDLRVQQMDTATGRVRISPGACAVLNRHPEARSEMYVSRAPGYSYLDIPANGTGTRTDLVGVRVDDPQYAGVDGPANETEAETWRFARPFLLSNASSGQVTAAQRGQLDLGFPVYWLAYIVIPSNTSAITSAMIKDLRQMAVPLQHAVVEGNGPTPNVGLTSTAGVVWPDFEPTVRVPSWATMAACEATINSVGQTNDPTQGYLTVVLNGNSSGGVSGYRAADIFFDEDAPQVGGSRRTYIVYGGWSDIRDIAGLTTTVRLEGRRVNTGTNPGNLVTVDGTQVTFKLWFSAAPVA